VARVRATAACARVEVITRSALWQAAGGRQAANAAGKARRGGVHDRNQDSSKPGAGAVSVQQVNPLYIANARREV